MKSHAKITCAAIALATIATGANAEPNKTFRQKMSGFEFGAGVPLVTPLTGYNVFFGYVNKNANTFLGRRFGIRADFNIPSELKLVGTISDKTDVAPGDKPQYVADGHGKIMGFDVKVSDFSDKKLEFDAFEDDRKNPISIGQNAADLSLKIKNQNMGLLIDFYPFADTWFLGGIRLTGGYYVGDFDISAGAHINNDINYSYKVGKNNNILHAQIAKGSNIGADFHWKYHGPYAGLGFDLGIWRGFKFFMDAGVVFAKAPKVTYANVHDDELKILGRYEIFDKDGNPYSAADEYVEILPGGISTAPNVENIVRDTVGIVIRDTLQDPKYGNVRDAIDNFTGMDSVELAQNLGTDIVSFLNYDGSTQDYINDAQTDGWVKTLLTDSNLVADDDELRAAVDDIKDGWKQNNVTSGIQKDINQAWEDYDKAKRDGIKDINDFLDDYGMMPIVKIGFMYRF